MKSFLRTKDFTVTGEEFELLYDESLQMLVTKPQPQNLDKYYSNETYISHTDSRKTVIDKLYQSIKRFSLWKKVRLIRKFSPHGKTLLDVGAGTGDFLLKAKNNKWGIEGVEPNFIAKRRAQIKGIELRPDLKGLEGNKYDVITLWHVLEHLPNLDEQIIHLVSLLTAKGTLVIAVPNFNSYDAKKYGKFWAAYDVPRHLWHFSKDSIEKIFSEHGMKVIKVKPMIFDSFYVSLLSEKYRKGRNNYFKAFSIGLMSNLAAWRTKEYSSQIYILKRA
ncbi:MAG: class I SAM-dependent methyltransferase [Maribacter sp.]|nr:class I SAM-dependent methyltransferase [Maribacter sp.]